MGKISKDWNNKSCQKNPKKTLHPKKSIPLLYDIIRSPPKADKALWPRLCCHPPACHSSICPPANIYCELLLGVWQTLSNFPTPPQHISSIQTRGHFRTAHAQAAVLLVPVPLPSTQLHEHLCPRTVHCPSPLGLWPGRVENVNYSYLNLST